jgi:tetratricopeptide (TPR) repeat protein
MERRRMDAAIEDLTSALRLLPNNASLLYYRGTAYYGRALGADDDISALADFEAAAHVFTDGNMLRRCGRWAAQLRSPNRSLDRLTTDAWD